MALSSGTKGFWFRGTMSGNKAAADVREYIIGNSKTITLGDAVTFDGSGYLQLAGAGNKIAGIVVGIVDKDGIPVFSKNFSGSGSVSGDDTYTTASDNTTVDQVKAQIACSTDNLWYNEADSTLSQAEVGEYFDLTAASDQVTGTGDTAVAQMQLVKLISTNGGPNSNGEGLFKIAESWWTTP